MNNDIYQPGWYAVTFNGDLFTLTTAMIDADSAAHAIRLAIMRMYDERGWDLDDESIEATAELEATY